MTETYSVFHAEWYFEKQIWAHIDCTEYIEDDLLTNFINFVFSTPGQSVFSTPGQSAAETE